MTLFAETALGNAVSTLWPSTETYRWMAGLSRLGWAWEFLRRNPTYIQAFQDTDRPALAVDQGGTDAALVWGLLRFENPLLDARKANVFWQLDLCREILPLTASPMRRGTEVNTLRLDKLQCRSTVQSLGDDGRRDVLFAQDGRFLQLAIFGDTPLMEALLLTPALPASHHRASRFLAVRRLADLVGSGQLRPSLYPRERRAPRLTRIAQALDGWLAHASYREIAIALFGAARVERDWSDTGDHLRDQIRRAVRYGRDLMEGGYRQFLT